MLPYILTVIVPLHAGFSGLSHFFVVFFLCFVPNLWLNCQHLDFVSFEGGFFLILLTPLCHDPTHIWFVFMTAGLQ